MTLDEHNTLSAELARALGWTTYDVGNHIYVDSPNDREPRVFDYRAFDVFTPLLNWLLTKPDATVEFHKIEGQVAVRVAGYGWYFCDTIYSALARAVIAVKKANHGRT